MKNTEWTQKNKHIKSSKNLLNVLTIILMNTKTDEMITKGCNVVIEFIRGKYEGQIKQIEL